MGDRKCPACSTSGLEPFYAVDSVPTNSCLLMESPEEARAQPRGDIRLSFCSACGFVSNVAFDPKLTEYSGRYEETQGFSETFNVFHESLAEELIQRHNLRGKDILEICCGKGEFLTLLSGLGDNRGLGFDPSYIDERDPGASPEGVVFRKEFFSAEHAHLGADLICCKMTLEHIHEPKALLSAVSRSAAHRDGTIVFFQVPDVTRILKDCAFEDIYYEHCSYFSAGSLGRLFRRFGFDILNLESVFDGQYLTIEACRTRSLLPADPFGEDDLAEHVAMISSCGERCRTKLRDWQATLDDYRQAGKSVVLWGSGSKAVSFLTTLDRTDVVQQVVDINPFRQGHFMPGTGQPIVAPDHLSNLGPHVVVVLNRVYTREIISDLQGRGLAPAVVAL